MAVITLKGREIPLLYTTWEMRQIQQEIGPLSEFQYRIFGRNPKDESDTTKYGSPEHLDAVATLIKILGNAGLEEAGEEPDLKEKDILRAMRPGDIVDAVNACTEAMSEGMASEIPEKKQEGRVDVTLEKINKKKGKGS